tara:strand:- start:376 stop:501 length:126 start_codon:yes stop_codon:yes gene_type:complete
MQYQGLSIAAGCKKIDLKQINRALRQDIIESLPPQIEQDQK